MIDSRLTDTSFFVIKNENLTLLLKNDSRFFWVMAVINDPNVSEIFDLNAMDYTNFMNDVAHVAKFIKHYTHADKMNIESIGNVVPQLHVHIIARHYDDECWPKPVWGLETPPQPYKDKNAKHHIKALQSIFERSQC